MVQILGDGVLHRVADSDPVGTRPTIENVENPFFLPSPACHKTWA